MDIDFANLQLQYKKYKAEIDKQIEIVLSKSNYILGEEVFELEKNLKNFTNAKNVISCSSGTDALLLAMLSIDYSPMMRLLLPLLHGFLLQKLLQY